MFFQGLQLWIAFSLLYVLCVLIKETLLDIKINRAVIQGSKMILNTYKIHSP